MELGTASPPVTVLCEEIDGRLYPCGRLSPRPEPISVTTPGTTPGYLSEEIDGVLYPYAEEEHVVQGTYHFQTVRDVSNMIDVLLRGRPGLAAFYDLLVYSRPGPGQRPCAPDLLIVEGLADPRKPRTSLRLWEEPCRPLFVLAVLSDWDASESFSKGLRRYQNEMCVPEYFVGDPRSGFTELDGYRLESGRYTLLEPDAAGRLWSEQLRAWWGPDEEGRLQIWDATGLAIPRYTDALAEAEQAKARVRELEAALAELRGGTP